MFPYWLLFSIFAVGSIQYRRAGHPSNQAAPLLAAAGIFTALMIGFRYEVGGDWFIYEGKLADSRYLDLAVAVRIEDPGYAFLSWLASLLGVGIWFVNLICGALFVWGLVKFARRQANPWLAILVAVPYLIIVVAMGYTRQAVAIGFVLAALSVLDRGKLAHFAIYLVLATLFHRSALVIVPLVALALTQNRYVAFPVLLVTAGLLYYQFGTQALDKMMTNYVEAGYSSQGAGVRVAMNIPPAALFLLFQKHFDMSPQQRKLWRNFSIASFIALFLLLTTASSTAVDRIALYLIPLQMVVLSRLGEISSERRKASGQLAVLVIAYCAAIQFVWLNYATHSEYWLPYRFYPLQEGGLD